MNSQLNPNAAVFVPVSPTKLLMMDDSIISASPGINFEDPAVNLEFSTVPKHVDYFMRDNFSTLPNIMNAPPPCPELTEHIPLDKLFSIQNIQENEKSIELGKAHFFGITKVLTNSGSQEMNLSENNNTSPTEFCKQNESVEGDIPETTTSLQVNVSCFKIIDDTSFCNNQTRLDIPASDIVADKQIGSDLVSSKDKAIKVLSSEKKKPKSSRHRYRKRPKKADTNVVENTEGFITEHRRTPPIDLTFKPIQTFGDENPFGALQTPTVSTPTDQFYNLAELYKTPEESPIKKEESYEEKTDPFSTVINIPPSFILRRSTAEESIVPFEELESSNELPSFIHPPNANRIIAETELPKSLETPEILDGDKTCLSVNVEHVDGKVDADNEDVRGIKDLIVESNIEKQTVSFECENIQENKKLSKMEFNTNESFLRPEYTINQPKECEKILKLEVDLKPDIQTIQPEESRNSDALTPKAEKPTLNKTQPEDSCGFEIFSSCNSATVEATPVDDHKTNIKEITLDVFAKDPSCEIQETSFIDEKPKPSKDLLDNELIEKELLKSESEIMENENVEETSTICEGNVPNVETNQSELNKMPSTLVPEALGKVPTKDNYLDAEIKNTTQQMKLELENQTSSSPTTPEELRILVQGFEVINKDELIHHELSEEPEKVPEFCQDGLEVVCEKEELVNVNYPIEKTDFKTDNSFVADGSSITNINCSEIDNNIVNNEFLNVLEKLSETETLETSTFTVVPHETISANLVGKNYIRKEEDQFVSEELILELSNPIEKLDLEDKNKQSVENEVISETADVTSTSQLKCVTDPSLNTVATEALLPSSETQNEAPLLEMTEVPLIAGTIPTSLLPLGLDKNKILEDSAATDFSTITAGEESGRKYLDGEKGLKGEQPEEVKKCDDKNTSKPADATSKPAKPEATTPAAKSTAVKTTAPSSKLAVGAKITSAATTGKISSVKPPGSSVTSTKVATSGTGTAKPSSSSGTSSKPGVTTSKSAASGTETPKSTASSNTTSKTTTTGSSKPTNSSVAATKSTTPNVPATKPSSSSVATSKSTNSNSEAPSKPNTSSATTTKPAASVSSSKSSAPSAVSSKTSTTSSVASKPTGSGAALSKSAPTPTSSKSAAVSKPTAPSTNNPGKPAPSNSTPVKPAVGNTIVKAAASSTPAKKPATTAAVKPATTAAVKPATAAAVKPAVSKTATPTVTKSTVTSTTSAKTVPKLLPVGETAPTTLKLPSKPSTPTSNPTTPTTPRSPEMKLGTKSPKPETKSPVPTKISTSPKATKDKPLDKKSATNADIKLPTKKAEAPKSATTAVAKPTSTKSTTGAKVAVGSATKSQTSAPSKPAASKTTTPANTTKPKSAEALNETSKSSTSEAAKKTTTTTGVKTVEKTGKDTISGKAAVNVKPTLSKTGVKSDPKANTKTGEKSTLIKKSGDEKSVKVQEHKVTTTKEIIQQSSTPPMPQINTETVN